MNNLPKDLQKKRLKKALTRTLMHRFYLYCALYAAIIIALFGAGYYVCSQKIWYESTPFYFLIHWLHEKWFECFLLFFVVGILLLTFGYFRKFIRILEYMLNEVEQMASETSESVEISQYHSQEPPEELREVQLQLVQIREQMEQNRRAAKEAEKRKNDLIVYMAHDLKTPLTSVIGYLNLLNEEKEISTQLREKYLGIALRKSERLEELINEFFDITRLQLSNMLLQKSHIDLGRMLEQIAYEFRPQLQERNISYELHLDAGLEWECDTEKIERVFDNLLKNAMHYSYEHTTIHISAYREDGNQIVVQLDNHGKTIPPEKLERIFEQFYRMDDSRDSYSGGAGLGLAIAKEIVEAHGGTIQCISQQEHICFKLVFPA